MRGGKEWETAGELAGKLVAMLSDRGLLVATAESCTGGLLSALLTAVPGSSACFDCALITYSNHSKSELLGVDAALIEQHGAVSEEVVSAMVQGLLARSRADLAVAISGIAGPGGATPDKPVGTVWLAWATRKGESYQRCCHFSGGRDAVRRQSVEEAISRLLTMGG
jgi:nicotinamide-nucleotide amidase